MEPSLDLKLNNKDGAGQEYINSLQSVFARIPIVINTGTPDNIDRKDIMNCFTKGEDTYTDIFNYFIDIYNTGLTKVLGAKGFFEEAICKVYKEAILPNKDKWIEYGKQEPEQTNRSLLRYTLNHIYYLLNTSDQVFLSEEFYLQYQENKGLETGLLFKYKTRNFIVITPACDLANSKTNYVQFLEIDSFDKTIRNILKITEGNEIPKNKDNRNRIGKVKNNNYCDYLHYLPESTLFSFEDSCINFRKTHAIDINIFKNRLEKNKFKCIAQVSSYFIKDIIARFSSYYARQGQPNIMH